MSEKVKILEGSLEYNHNLNAPDESEDIEVYYGPIEEGKLRYIWLSEPGACKECQKLDGKIYDSANDIPPKPHPNCKCHVEPIKSKTPTKDPIEQRREKALEQERKQLELDKLKGDAEVLLEEIKETEPQIVNIENKIKQIEVSKKDLTDKQKEKIQKAKQDLLQYRNDESVVKKRLLEIIDIAVGTQKEWNTNKYKLSNISQTLANTKQWLGKVVDLELFNYILKLAEENLSLPASGQLWTNSYKGLDNKKEDYSYNIIDSVFDIEDEKNRNFIIDKLKSQNMYYSVRGINYTDDSIISEKIKKSEAIERYIRENKSKFKPNTYLPNSSLEFKLNEFDLYSAFHYADIIDIYIDSDETLHAKVVDTYDFNKKSINPLVKIARYYQDLEWIEGYYSIIDITIPKNVWKHY